MKQIYSKTGSTKNIKYDKTKPIYFENVIQFYYKNDSFKN